MKGTNLFTIHRHVNSHKSEGTIKSIIKNCNYKLKEFYVLSFSLTYKILGIV